MARPKKTASATPATAPATAAAAKTRSKKAAEKPASVEMELYLQAGGGQWNVSDCRERVMAACAADGHEASGIEKLTVYLKPEEGKAYYVVNDDVSGSIDL